MKKMGIAMVTAGVVTAGVVGYVLMNKKTRAKADKLLNTVMEEADSKMKQMMH